MIEGSLLRYVKKWRDNRHFFIVFVLGFSSGLPFTLVGTTLAAWFAKSGQSITNIGLLTLIGQPYIFKFLWAPLLDISLFKRMGKRRAWLLLTQALLLICILTLSFLSPIKQPVLIALVAWLIALFSATQDIAVDAFRSEVLLPHDRGFGATLAVFSFRMATLFSGALALVWADHYGWRSTFIILSLCLLPVMCSVYFTKEPKHPKPFIEEISYLEPFLFLLKRPHGLWMIAFVFLYKLAEAFTSTSSGVTMAFLIQDLHFDLSTIGLTGKGVGIIATIIGSFIAGVSMLRLSLYRALLIFGIFQAVTNLLFVLLAILGKDLYILMVAVLFDNMAAGMGMTALIAFMMAWSDKHYTASHFALLSAISALPRMLSGPIAAYIELHIGWVGLYTFATFAALPCLLLLMMRKNIFKKLNDQ